MFAPQMLINHESLSILEESVEYGGYRTFVKWRITDKIKTENKTHFWIFSLAFLKEKYKRQTRPAQPSKNKKYANIYQFLVVFS